jgi:hypothetical protein
MQGTCYKIINTKIFTVGTTLTGTVACNPSIKLGHSLFQNDSILNKIEMQST